jgi:integrase
MINRASALAAADPSLPTLNALPTRVVLRQEMTAYLEATPYARTVTASECWKRLAEFMALYPRPQMFFDLDLADQIEEIQNRFPAVRHFPKVFAFLWLHDYARPSFELLWSAKFRARVAVSDARALWAEELGPFREMAASIGYHGNTILRLEARLIEMLLVTGKRQLSQLTFAELEALHTQVDKTLAPGQVRADVPVFADGVKLEVRWTLRGVSKVFMAMGMNEFAEPIERRYAVETIPLEKYFEPIINPLVRASLIQYCREMSTIRRPGTINIYRRALFDFAWYIQANFPEIRSYGELHRDPHITGWLQHLSERHTDNQLAVSRAGHPRPKLTSEGRRKVIYMVSAFLHRLAIWEHPNAPTRVLFDKDDAPRHEEPLPFALEDWQARRIIEAAHKTKSLLGKVATLMLLRTGMRIGEFLLLETNSFVRRKDPVYGREVTWIRVPIIKLGQGREVPLAFDDVEQAVEEWNAHRPFLPKRPHPRTGKLVEFWLAGGNGYGSPGEPITYVAVLKALDRVVEEAGLDSGKVWPHRYRHTLGTLLINQPDVKEATVSTLLGHGPNRAMTSRYAKIKNRTLLNDLEKLHEALDDLFIEDGPSTEGLEVESPYLRELRLAAQKAWRDQGYCYCTRSEHTFCVAEEGCLKCELATFSSDHLMVLRRMAADAEGKGQVKRLSLIVKAIQKAQKTTQQASWDFPKPLGSE